MISLAGLFTLGISFFSSMAIGTIGVVFVSVVGSLTLLPAALAIAGDRVDRGRPATWIPRLLVALPVASIRRGGRAALDWLDRRARRPEGSGFWARLVTAVMARPVLMTAVSALLLLALASPIARLRIGVTDITGFPASVDGIAGILLLQQKFPAGTDLRLDVVVTQPNRPDVRAAIERLETAVLAIPGVSGPPPSGPLTAVPRRVAPGLAALEGGRARSVP